MSFACNIPCIVCAPSIGGGVGPVDPANPFVNLSSETPDVDMFIGSRFGPPGPPPLGWNFEAAGCVGWCYSNISQEAADLCAAQQAVLCLPDVWPQPCPTCIPTPQNPFPENPAPIYYNFPQSCQITCPDNSVYTFTVAAGIFSSPYNQDTVDEMARSYACNKAALNQICMGTLSPTRTCSNAAYVGSVTVSTINTPVTFEMITVLPDGLFLSQNPTTAFISGTPTTPGDAMFTILATDAIGQTVMKALALSIFGVASSDLPDGNVGEPYSYQLLSGGTTSGAVTWFISFGTLPDGLTLDSSTGEISGTPTTEETQSFTVSVSNGGLVCHKSLGIQVAGCGLPENSVYSGNSGVIGTGWDIVLPEGFKMVDTGGGFPGFLMSAISDGQAKVSEYDITWGSGATFWFCIYFESFDGGLLTAQMRTIANMDLTQKYYMGIQRGGGITSSLNQLVLAIMGDAHVVCTNHCVGFFDESLIVWDPPTINQGGAASVAATSSGLGGSMQLSSPGGLVDDCEASISATWVVPAGTYGYEFTMRIIVSAFSGLPGNVHFTAYAFNAASGFGDADLTLISEDGITINAPGVYDFPWVIPAPPGSNVVIGLDAEILTASAGGSIDVDIVFMPIP